MGHNQIAVVFFLLFIHVSVSVSSPESILQLLPSDASSLPSYNNIGHRKFISDDFLFCEGWRFTIETNDAGPWNRIPSRCLSFVQDYMTGDRYLSDSEAVADSALAFAKKIEVSDDGKDAWVFDIDETLLSNVPFYQLHGFGSEIFDEQSFNDWVDLAEAPALPASLRFYDELKNLGVKIFLLTGRSEFQRNVTVKNLDYAGYSNWERLFLRGPSDQGTHATVYKSAKRKELEDEGYRILGSSGDQWSDLIGYAIAKRSFKLPNPMYYIA
ncbi:hypothetical protein M9H77_23906 [Catharanthus roseus]|uniref:Uncharacterized protein n=1 Tax=Catharanthus roseus TaxID=4058 RepID=A0ACC0AYR6_CATRO|nr:hypothetical protein M9H77_23906 [Catharanthus roseus]